MQAYEAAVKKKQMEMLSLVATVDRISQKYRVGTKTGSPPVLAIKTMLLFPFKKGSGPLTEAE